MKKVSEKSFCTIKESRTSCGYGSFFIIKTPKGEKELKDEDSGDVYQVKIAEDVLIPCTLNVRSVTTDQKEGAWKRVTEFTSFEESSPITVSARNGLMVKKDKKLTKLNRTRESMEKALKERDCIQGKIDELVNQRTLLEKQIATFKKTIDNCN